MRLLLLFAAAVCFAQPSGPRSAISGRVVSAATGAPLKKVSVWVESFAPERGGNGASAAALPAVTTDAEGRFVLDGLAAGSYLLLARRTGYLDQGYGASEPQIVGPPLNVPAGDTLRDLVIKLTPQSLIYGKVVDEDGDALPNAQVQVLRVSFAGGRRRLVEAGAAASQDDGSFVVGNLTPGRYYLSAALREIDEGAPPQRRPERDHYITTYLPGTADATQALPVDLAPGGDARGLVIRMRKERSFHIRGRVVLPDGGTAGRVALRLLPRGGDDLVPTRGARSEAGGHFEFEGVPPGSYTIETDDSVGFGPAPADPDHVEQPRGRAIVSVADGDVDDAVLPVGPGVTVVGRAAGAAQGRVALTPSDGSASPYEARIGKNGHFEFGPMLPQPYDLSVAGLPEGAYVKAIYFGGRAVDDWKIDLTSGAEGELRLEVSPDAAEVAGVVRNAAGDPAAGATVEIWPVSGEGARAVKSGPDGAFRFRSLPPGAYRVAAWQDLDDDLAQYAPFRAQFETQAAKVEIGERGRERVDLQLIGRDAVRAEAAKLK